MGMGSAPTWLCQVSPPASQNHFNHWPLLALFMFVFCLLVVFVRLPVPVQVTDCKDSSPKSPIMCWRGTLNPTHSLARCWISVKQTRCRLFCRKNTNTSALGSWRDLRRRVERLRVARKRLILPGVGERHRSASSGRRPAVDVCRYWLLSWRRDTIGRRAPVPGRGARRGVDGEHLRTACVSALSWQPMTSSHRSRPHYLAIFHAGFCRSQLAIAVSCFFFRRTRYARVTTSDPTPFDAHSTAYHTSQEGHGDVTHHWPLTRQTSSPQWPIYLFIYLGLGQADHTHVGR